ncbi:LOW QUALITY PROTEIN: hypothetical protein CVT26_001463 [Gymnopilus dilepis]|uniref:Uncharacterized protein n=1 Tax=Gymnopilus dilepis TaxID=231916 RepID=A0A409WBD7_9AGAR|nr:LOW QUALITY PROTEIN: hypothetical protein CVT26_001463 [Gymnopilus dilepis]
MDLVLGIFDELTFDSYTMVVYTGPGRRGGLTKSQTTTPKRDVHQQTLFRPWLATGIAMIQQIAEQWCEGGTDTRREPGGVARSENFGMDISEQSGEFTMVSDR